MRYTRFASIVVMFLVVASVAWGATGYDIKEMSSGIVITPEGVYQVDEHIAMDFHVPLHGFYRVLPVEYLFEDSQREDVKVRVTKIKASDTFTVMRNGPYITIRVGDANRTVVGSQQYDISYNYDIGADPHDGYDEFYFNIVGEDWEVPIGKFTFSITFPSPISADSVSFTRGFWGSTTAQGLRWQLSGDGTVITGESTRLEPGEAITVRVEMPDGYFTARKDWQAVYRIVFLILSLLLVALAWYFWHAYGRDKDLIVVPRFEAPDGMSPLDVGYIIDESLDPRDVTSMIFYWADKGCLTIVEEGKKFSFIKGHDPKNASKHEKQIFDAFFASGTNGVVKTADLEGRFFQAYQKLKKTVDSHYRGERALASTRSRNKAALITLFMLVPAIGYALILTGNYLGPGTLVLIAVAVGVSIPLLLVTHVMMRSWHIRKAVGKLFWPLVFLFVLVFGWVFLIVAGWIVDSPMDDILFGATLLMVANGPMGFLAIVTKQRSDYGRRRLEEVLGFRDFIEKVEIDELKRMIDSDPNYYYHMLSFAIVLGLEKKWAKKFDSITIEPPNWYVGTHTVWNAMVLSSMLSRCNTALVSSVITSPKASPGSRFGGSSFGGGGFSGGGFGGGGGGAW